MKEETIHFDNGREAQEIVGLREEHLPGLEQSFAVKAVARDTWLKLSGAAESVAVMKRVDAGAAPEWLG